MSENPIEVMVPHVLIEPLRQWLGQRGLLLARFPAEMQEEDRLEAYFIAPTDEAMRRAGG